MSFTIEEIEKEANRLFEHFEKISWSLDECRLYARMTLEINQLKKEKNTIILAHSYQTPDIMYGVADYIGDSYGLSIEAMQTKAERIIFSSVYFMGETAKILNPNKEVLVPKIAGCSLASSITRDNVITLKKKYPNKPVVCYINTTAEVKAECDICVTSSNALKIINSLPENEIIFIPDLLMAKNIQTKTNKKIIPWDGTCIVHEQFKSETIELIRKTHPKVKILSHTECNPEVVKASDMSGGTSDMIKYITDSDFEKYMLITECGLTDRMKIEMPQKNFVNSCTLCPYMKKIGIKDILEVLKNPREDHIIKIDAKTLKSAKKCLDKMIELA